MAQVLHIHGNRFGGFDFKMFKNILPEITRSLSGKISHAVYKSVPLSHSLRIFPARYKSGHLLCNPLLKIVYDLQHPFRLKRGVQMVGHSVDKAVAERFILQQVAEDQVRPFSSLETVRTSNPGKHIVIRLPRESKTGVQIIKHPSPAAIQAGRCVSVELCL